MAIEVKEVNILGSEWTIESGNENTHPVLNGKNAYCDCTTRTIVIEDFSTSEVEVADIETLKKTLLRHEVLHAYFDESGLQDQSNRCEAWAVNEEMIDWFAVQSPKIFRTYTQLGIL